MGNLKKRKVIQLDLKKIVLLIILFSIIILSVPNSGQAKSIITVGIFQNEPMIFWENEQPKGLFIDILEEVGERENWELQYVQCEFTNCLEMLAAGILDIVPDIAYSEERALLFDFNQETVISNWGQFYSDKSNDFHSFIDLNDKTLAVVTDDIYASEFKKLAENMGIQPEFVEYTTYENALQAMIKQECDAALVSRISGLASEKKFFVKRSTLICCPIEIRYAINKNVSSNLISAIDQNLRILKEDEHSVYYQSLSKWISPLNDNNFNIILRWLSTFAISIALALLISALLLKYQISHKTKELQNEIETRKTVEIALRENKNRYRAIVEDQTEMIIRWKPDSTITFTNKAYSSHYRHILGEDLVGKKLLDVFPCEIAKTIPGIIKSLTPFSSTVKVENPTIDPAGNQRWLLWIHHGIFDDQGKLQEIQSIGRDITDTKLRQAEQEAFISVATALNPLLSYEEIHSIAMEKLTSLLNCDGAIVMRTIANGDQFELTAATKKWAACIGIITPSKKGISYQIAQSKLPFVTHDSSEATNLLDLLPNVPRSIAGVPVIIDDQVASILWIGRETNINSEELRIMTIIADLMANALHRAYLHRQVKTQLERVSALHDIDLSISKNHDLAPICEVLGKHLSKQLNVEGIQIHQYFSNERCILPIYAYGFSKNLLYPKTTALTQSIVAEQTLKIHNNGNIDLNSHYPDEDFRTYIGLPLSTEDEITGVLEVFSHEDFQPTLDWLNYFETLAGQAIIAIENVTLFKNLQNSSLELEDAYDTTLVGWANALELRDQETEGHSQRVTQLTVQLAKEIGLPEEEIIHLRRGALLHDIGKMGIPDSILQKPGSLTEAEWQIMRTHPVLAYQLLSKITFLKPALDIPHYHHEKWDGSGYPDGLVGEDIPLYARIFAIIDVWDALNSERPYRKAWPKEPILNLIREERGKHFDPTIADAFLKMIEK
jgi:PAS domain S-box-containing protein/putative nucleotidyltransferase with HDIG domain